MSSRQSENWNGYLLFLFVCGQPIAQLLVGVAAVGFAICLVRTDAFGQSKTGPAKHAEKQITIGDITITGFQSSRADQASGGFIISGSGTTVTAPDPASHTTLIVHADEIRGVPDDQTDSKEPGSRIDMEGHITFQIRQSLPAVNTKTGHKPAETRIVNGTAGHILYRKTEKIVHLTRGVRATILDPANLNGPAHVTSDSMSIDIAVAPSKLMLDGDADHDSLVFTPASNSTPAPVSGQATKTHSVKPADSTPIHVTGFVKGQFQAGETAEFSGPAVRIETERDYAGNRFNLVSTGFSGSFDTTGIRKIKSAGVLEYGADQVVDRQTLQEANGRAGHGELRVPEKILDLSGGSKTTLINNQRLVGPGTFQSGQATLNLASSPYVLTATGTPDINDVQFTLKPAPNRDPKQRAEPPLPVHISRFDSIPIMNSEEAVFVGSTTSLEVGTEDGKGSNRGPHLIVNCDRLSIHFRAKDHSIESAQALGHVRYHAARPAHNADATGPAISALTVVGTAQRGDFRLPDPATHLPANAPEMTLYAVSCTITDSLALDGPATIHADRVHSASVGKSSRLTITGNALATDIRASLRTSTTPQMIHLYGFSTADMLIGTDFHVVGTHLTWTMEQSSKQIGTLKRQINCNQIEGMLDATTGELAEATAKGDVALTSQDTPPTPTVTFVGTSSKAERRLAARSEFAHYAASNREVALKGHVDATVSDSLIFTQPAHVTGGSVVLHLTSAFPDFVVKRSDGVHTTSTQIHVYRRTPEAGKKPLAGAKSVARPRTVKPAEPLEIDLTNFDSAAFTGGEGMVTDGLDSSLRTEQGNRKALLLADNITAKLLPDGSALDSAVATGHVRYHAESQDDVNHKQSITGTSDTADIHTETAQLHLKGNATATLEDSVTMSAPGHISGSEITLSGQEQRIIQCTGSPGAFEFTMIQREPPATAGAAAHTAKPAPQALPAAAGTTHFVGSGFDSAIVAPGSGASMDGPGSRLVIDDSSKQTHTDIQALQIKMTRTGERETESTQASATGSVHFEFVGPLTNPDSPTVVSPGAQLHQSCEGTSASINYNASADKQLATIMGPMAVVVVNSVKLEEPATVDGLEGQSLTVLLKGNQPPDITWDGHGKQIEVKVKPKSAKPVKPVAGGATANGSSPAIPAKHPDGKAQ